MQAVVRRRYGSPDVLELADVPRPAPGSGEVLVRVRAASANAGDWRILRGAPFLVRLMGYGLLAPKHPVLGQDVAGQVAAAGAGVTRFREGDEVFGESPGCGTFAEYVCVPAERLAPKPASLSFEQAAAVPMAASPPAGDCARRARCSPASACWSTARPAAWARMPCRSRTRSARA